MFVATLWLVGGGRAVGAQSAPPVNENGVEKLYQAGLTQAKAGHIDEAIAMFKRGLEIEPHNAPLLDAAGAAYSLKGDLEGARQSFVESLSIAPESTLTRQNLGIVLFSLGEYGGASEPIQAVSGTCPANRMLSRVYSWG